MDMYDRIAHGMTTVDDAEVYAQIVARLDRYELALRYIAVNGDARSAMLALRVLLGDLFEGET